ncbi:polysialyltransferase family glycosyltransferase [Ulvibacter antarcticus]|nr:polysialyltransferase family glycosyltransferase [Ulvibacter antarcticus]
MYSKVKEYSVIVKKLNSYRNQPCRIYLAYIEDVLSNYLFFNFNKEAEIVVVEDGTLNYYNHTMSNIDGLKFKLKKLIAKLHGLRFQEYEGHSSGAAYSKVVEQYLTFPEEAYVSKNAKQLPIIKETIENPVPELYIIGQEAFGAIVGNEYFLKELANYFSELRKQDFYDTVSKIYYKPHRNGIRLSKEYISDFFPEKEVVFLNTTKTSEEVYFEEIQCAYISSFNSSTLINIFSKLRKEERDLFEFYIYPLRKDELSPLFKKLNFKFLN